MLSHNVFFTLKDRTPSARSALVKSCQRHLTGHPGIVFFACGTREEGLARAVNDLEFDVALHIVFATKGDHDAYQVAPRHNQFVSENHETWAKVRVFDAAVEVAPAAEPSA